MGLHDRIKGSAPAGEPSAWSGGAPAPAAAQDAPGRPGAVDPYAELKTRIHHACIATLGQELFRNETTEDLSERVLRSVTEQLALDRTPLTREERRQLVGEISDDILGYGPLEPLLRDDSVSEVMVNGFDCIYVERDGKLERAKSAFVDNAHVLRIIDKIVSQVGRRIDEASPMVDARLPDGSRVNAIIPPLSLRGPVLTIRKFARDPYTVDDLITFGTLSAKSAQFLSACVRGKLNILISGGTGTGKTTMLNGLSAFIPASERIVTIEDAAELQLQQDHVVTLESRPPNVEGHGEVRIRELVRNALRMRPDRIIVGEVRGAETLDMLQAMNTGHEGSLTTIHANTPRDALARLETLVLTAGVDLPLRAIREQIASAVDLIVHTARLKDGSRKVVNITEVFGIEDDDILMQDVFVFQQTGLRDGRIEGLLKPTGIRPTFMGKFKSRGIQLPPGEFGIPAEDPMRPDSTRRGKGRVAGETLQPPDGSRSPVGYGRAVSAGGMVYVSSIGPVDPETGQVVSGAIKEQARQCLQNLKARLEAAGSSLDKVVWANWSLRDPAEFDTFNEEWARWFPGDTPIGQGTLMPLLQRRAGFRISIGVIAEA